MAGCFRGVNDRVLQRSSFANKFLVLAILSMMNEVVDEVEVLGCLWLILDVLIEEVAREEIVLRPPGDGDVGQDVRWVNHFGVSGERSRSS